MDSSLRLWVTTGLFIFLAMFLFLFLSTGSHPKKVQVQNNNRAIFAILPRFDTPGSFHQGIAPVQKREQWGYIEKNGEWLIEPKYEAALGFKDDIAAVKQNGNWGFIDKKGKWIIEPQFEKARSFNEGRAAVQRNSKWGFILNTGRNITEFKFNWVSDFNNGRAVIAQDEKKEFINREGDRIVGLQFEDAGQFSSGFAPVKTKKGWGYIDRKGDQVVPFKYKWASKFENDMGRVKINQKWKFITITDTTPKTVSGDFVSVPGKNGTIRVRKNGRIGFLNRSLEKKIPFNFDQALSFQGTLTPAQKDDLWGYIDHSGNWIIQPKFHSAGPFDNNRAPVKIGSRWGYIPKPNSHVIGERKKSEFWVDTGIRHVKPELMNQSLDVQYPVWRYRPRDRYVRVLSTSFDHWIREDLLEQSNFGMPNAKYEVTRFPYEEPTYLQIEAAEQFFLRSLGTAWNKNWFLLENGLKDGFGTNLTVDDHFFKMVNIRDDLLLAPSNPESLIYKKNGSDNRTLVGMMYYQRSRREEGPQIGGPITNWHYHIFDDPVCHNSVIVRPRDKKCKDGKRVLRSAEMIHTWFVRHPDGTFATDTDLKRQDIETFLLNYNPIRGI